MDSSHLVLLGERAGKTTIDLDQPGASKFLHYTRFQGNAFRYQGSREPRFTNEGYGLGPQVMEQTVSGCSQAALPELRRATRRQVISLHTTPPKAQA